MNSPRLQLIALATFLAVSTLFAQEPIKCSPTEAASHYGELAAVTGKVDGFHESKKGNVFLDLGGRYPAEAFTAFIPAAHAAAIPNAKDYEGKMITVTGKITPYKGKPEIIVTSAAQLSTTQ